MTSTFAADVPPTPRAGRLASAALLLSASFVLSRILGLLRNSVIAAVFGNHGPIESYFAAFRIPDTIFTLVSGGALASAFIPVFAGLVHSHEEDEAWQVTSSVFNAVCVALAGLALVAFIFAPIIIGLVFGGFSGPRQSMTVDLTRIMLLQPIFLGAAAVISGVLQTYHRFVLTAVAPLIYNVVVIVGALMGHHYGLTGLAWSVVIGALAQVLIQLPGVWPDARWTYRFSLNFDSPHVREVMRLFGPRVVGLAAFQAMLFITYALASYLPGGMIPAINYSWVLIAFPVGALGTAAAQAVFPTLSRLSASEDLATVRYTVNRSLRLILFLALPSAAGLIVLRRPVVNLLYHRGDFTSLGVEQTAYALLFYSMAIAQLSAVEILPRVFYAMRDTLTPVRIAVVAVILDAALSVLFVHLFPRGSGQGGLALATAIATTLQALWLARSLGQRLGGIGSHSLLLVLRDAAAATFVMAIVLYVLLDPLSAILPQRGIGVLITVLFELVVGAATFSGVAYLLGAPELWQVRGFFFRKK